MAEFLDITKNLLVSLNASFKLQYPFIELNFCDKFVYIKNIAPEYPEPIVTSLRYF